MDHQQFKDDHISLQEKHGEILEHHEAIDVEFVDELIDVGLPHHWYSSLNEPSKSGSSMYLSEVDPAMYPALDYLRMKGFSFYRCSAAGLIKMKVNSKTVMMTVA